MDQNGRRRRCRAGPRNQSGEEWNEWIRRSRSVIQRRRRMRGRGDDQVDRVQTMRTSSRAEYKAGGALAAGPEHQRNEVGRGARIDGEGRTNARAARTEAGQSRERRREGEGGKLRGREGVVSLRCRWLIVVAAVGRYHRAIGYLKLRGGT